MNASAFIKVDKATFFKVAERHEGRCEYVRGRVIMQAGGSRRHSAIAREFLVTLVSQLDRKLWAAFGSDLAIDVGDVIRYPDVFVEPAAADPDGLASPQPVLVVEVLSPSSEERDLETKPEEYFSIPSLQAYIVASQDEAVCLVWLRGPDGNFPAEPVEIAGVTSVIRIPPLSVEIALADIYRGIF
jgi:Uma2 family endonuclease